MTRRTLPLIVPGVTEAEVAVGARVVMVEQPCGACKGQGWVGIDEVCEVCCGYRAGYGLIIEEPEPQGQTERRRWTACLTAKRVRAMPATARIAASIPDGGLLFEERP